MIPAGRKVAIHQPQVWPWAGYLQKVLAADTFVYLDSVQFSKNGFQNRNQIKGANGPVWLTVPVKQQLGQRICDTPIADQSWPQKHLATLTASYARTPGFQRWKDELTELHLGPACGTIAEFAIRTTEWMLEKLGATAERVKSSALGEISAKNSGLVAELCVRTGAQVYLTGVGGLEYMAREDFAHAGIQVWAQEARGFEYAQQFPRLGFVPHLSTLDLLLNQPDEAAALLAANCDWKPVWQDAPAAL